jgi:hypothetical protein
VIKAGFVPESIRNVCKASNTKAMLVGLGFVSCDGRSLNIDCNGVLTPRVFERLWFRDAKPWWLDGDDGEVDRVGRLGEAMIPFFAD